jgi:hypothetical protein
VACEIEVGGIDRAVDPGGDTPPRGVQTLVGSNGPVAIASRLGRAILASAGRQSRHARRQGAAS